MLVIKKNKIFIISIILVIAVSLTFYYFYIDEQLKYKYWHFLVHHKLTFLLDKEFKDLMERYAKEDNFASFVDRGGVGIIVGCPVGNDNFDYSIQLRLRKDIKKNTFSFKAEICSRKEKAHYDTGNPPIYLEIPMKHFKEIVENGLTQRQIDRLLKAAREVGWEELELNKEIKIKPPIILRFDPR